MDTSVWWSGDLFSAMRATIGEEAWDKGMNPDIPEAKVLDNPYTYTEYRSASTHARRD
nr:hypothetical protein [Catenulispora pinisilvae]